MKQRIYISLPISGREEDARKKANLMKEYLYKQGYKPISPFDIYCGENPAYEDYICHDLRTLLDCDGAFFCEGWKDSCGCQIEYDVVMRFKAYGKKDFKVMFEE